MQRHVSSTPVYSLGRPAAEYTKSAFYLLMRIKICHWRFLKSILIVKFFRKKEINH
jgi:hypothetical protein